jgi:hypothetical protein
MNPDKILEELRQMALCRFEGKASRMYSPEEMCDKFLSLDRWLSTGGAAPKAWIKAFTRKAGIAPKPTAKKPARRVVDERGLDGVFQAAYRGDRGDESEAERDGARFIEGDYEVYEP